MAACRTRRRRLEEMFAARQRYGREQSSRHTTHFFEETENRVAGAWVARPFGTEVYEAERFLDPTGLGQRNEGADPRR